MSAGENASMAPRTDATDATSTPDAAGADLPVVFLLDCDNTLLDNDALKQAFHERLRALLGLPLEERFWQVYEAVRADEGMVDLPATFARFAPLAPSAAVAEQVRATIMDAPFATFVYRDTPATIAYLKTLGTPVILSDGDPVYQPRKIDASGLEAAVDGAVLVVDHKEQELGEVERRWPARFYVAVDDKGRILADLKRMRPDRFVTVQVLQGHYAERAYTPAPDIRIAEIGDLRRYSLADFTRYLAQPAR